MLEAVIVTCQPVLQHLVRIFWPDSIDCAVHNAFKLCTPQLRKARSQKSRNLDDHSISLVNITRTEGPGPDDVNTDTYSMRTFHRHSDRGLGEASSDRDSYYGIDLVLIRQCSCKDLKL